MRWLGIIGCVLQGYGFPVGVLLYAIVKQPLLPLITLAGAFGFIMFPLLLNGILFHIASKATVPIFAPLFSVCTKEVIRYAFFVLQRHVRALMVRVHKSLILWTPSTASPPRYRLETMVIGAAFGLGFGLCQTFLSFGVTVSYFIALLANTNEEIRAINSDSASFFLSFTPAGSVLFSPLCEGVPFLFYLSLVTLAINLLQMLWTVVLFHAYDHLLPVASTQDVDEPSMESLVDNSAAAAGTPTKREAPDAGSNEAVPREGKLSSGGRSTEGSAANEDDRRSNALPPPADATPRPALVKCCRPPCATGMLHYWLTVCAVFGMHASTQVLLDSAGRQAADDKFIGGDNAVEAKSGSNAVVASCDISLPIVYGYVVVAAVLSYVCLRGVVRRRADNLDGFDALKSS